MQTNIKSNVARLASLVILAASLAACGGGGSGDAAQASNQTQVGSATETSDAPVSTPSQAPAAAGNRAPTISGKAIASIPASQTYNFVPAAVDADGDKLTFAISSKPEWAQFDTATGRLTGTPTNANVGSYEEIEISVTDGKATTKLAQFSITVEQGAATMRNVLVSWQPPTTNADGSALTNLKGYKILYGTAAGNYSKTIDVNGAGLTSFTLEGLEAGQQYHVVMIAVNSAGSQSEMSQEVVLSAT